MGLLRSRPRSRGRRGILRLRHLRVRRGVAKRPRGPGGAARTASEPGRQADQLPEAALRNVALEAVRTGNYYAEDPEEIYRYIAEIYAGLLADEKWLKKNHKKLSVENGLTRRYTVEQILRKQHEADGFDIFVDPDEACLAKAAAEQGPRRGPAELEPGKMAELEEGLAALVAAASGKGDPVSAEEVLDLLKGCAAAGEVGAAVYCGERLEAMHGGNIPAADISEAFEALKPLLRPNAAQPKPRLEGPWSMAPPGRHGAPNPRKGLGQLFQRLASLRKEQEVAAGGEAAAKAATMAAGDAAMGRLAGVVAGPMAEDQEARAASRRGQFALVVERLCETGGVPVSKALAHAVVQRLVDDEVLSSRGREVALDVEAKRAGSGQLREVAADIASLEAFASDRLDRRKRRHQARERGRASKRRRGT